MRRHGCAIVTAALICLITFITVPGALAVDVPPGWTLSNPREMESGVYMCEAELNTEGPAELAIIAAGLNLFLNVRSPDFSGELHEEVISLRTASLPRLQRTAFAGIMYALKIDDEIKKYLVQGDPLTCTIKGKDYSFAVTNAAAAISAAQQCVLKATGAQLPRKAPPFRMPDGWTLADLGNECSARLQGSEVNTWVAINERDEVIVTAARADWDALEKEIEVTLQIDAERPKRFTAVAFNKLVLVVLRDAKDVAALRKASTLWWRMPTGNYAAKVHDVGAALDAATACTRQKRSGLLR